ncbi:Vitamin B12 transporter BtuB [Polaribacter huanghezhanensis]|uniref:outer membrane beta-barrel family protein n=1 Tax=Polaribacter huanghezhanensis TaxID=1354726 RepID=UPI002647F32D|nr:outer membrane beta-barrel family protein [Polaribacter huanghezhanensis]WKD86834.1 Vitamin B12 transporter BtuB [Polaribacter huanghezhanensis]
MKKTILVLICLFSISALFAQRPSQAATYAVFGKVIDKDTKQPLEYATIVLKNLKSNKLSGGITDGKGEFYIKITGGTYNISIEFISFKTIRFNNRTIDKNINLGTVILSEDGEMLDEVNIIPEKSTVDIRLDKKIYNVGKDMTVKGGNVADVLDNVPSVSVDVEGNVSLRGNENVRILIDGKPSSLVGLDGTSALRQLPADAIERVEVITSPSARYDAEGTAGILNIILRKGKVTGFNGSINPTIGDPTQYGISTNLNYRTKKFNLFTNTGYNYRNGPGKTINNSTYFDNSGTITGYLDELKNNNRLGKGFNSSFGLEYYINNNSSLLGNIVIRKSDGQNTTSNNVSIFDANKNLTDTRTRDENELSDSKSIQYSLNYTNRLNDYGKKLTIDLQYSKSDQDKNGSIFQNNAFVENNSTLQNSTRKLFQIDYVFPRENGSQFELGYKADLDKSTSDYKNSPAVPYSDPKFNLSNNLDFEQNVYALYIQYGKKIEKFSYLFGLRGELTEQNISLLTTNENYNKSYAQLFPTINLGYELSDNESITLGYSKRLRRPRSWFLNPFESRSSETNIFKGNVNLDPTFTNSFDLGYLKKWDKLTLNSSIYYRHSTGIYQFISEERGDFVNGIPVIVRSPINLSSEDRYGFEFNTNYSISKKVNLSGSFNFYGFETVGKYNNVDFGNKDSNWDARFNSRITLPASIQWQTTMSYRGGQKNAQSTSDGIFSANLAFSKDLFKDNGTLVLNISDVLNSRKRKGYSYTPNSSTYGEMQWRQRQVSLSFVYRFNQKKNQKQQRPQQNNDFEEGGEGFGK